MASDGSGLRMFQAVIDARTLLLEVGAQKRDVSIALCHIFVAFEVQETMYNYVYQAPLIQSFFS